MFTKTLKILNLLKSETFNVLEFDKLLRELSKSNIIASDVNPPGRPLAAKSSEVKPAPLSQLLTGETQKESKSAKANQQSVVQTKEEVPVPPKVEIPKMRPDIPKYDLPEKADQGNGKSMKYKSEAMIAGIVLQSVIVLLAGVVLFTGILKPLGNDMAVNVFALLVIGGAASYFVWKKILSSSNMVECDASGNAAGNKINMGKMEIRPARERIDVQSPVNKPKDNAKAAIESPHEDAGRKIIEDKREDFVKVEMPKIQNYEDTVMIEVSVVRSPYLEGRSNGTVEEIIINKMSFVIGRLPDQVDYVSRNNAVGKVHAEIITRDGRYYLKDLNSRNGSFINGERIDSGKEYEINNNDRISFANSDYRFIVP